MWQIFLFLLFLEVAKTQSQTKKPTILISILVRNKAHTLPYFLSNLERLNYPKNRLSLLIKSDHNLDNSIEILTEWINLVKNEYHSIETDFQDQAYYEDETGPAHWSPKRFQNVIASREQALSKAKDKWADYLLSLDADIFITNPETLNYLTSLNYTVVSPMLKSDGLYSNFWYGMTEDYYYLRTEEYKPVLYQKQIGCFNVPMIHSFVLIDLRKVESDKLTYNPDKIPSFQGPNDDIIAFAISARLSNISLYICNELSFGYIMVPLEQEDKLELDYEQLTNIKLEVLNNEAPLFVTEALRQYTWLPEKDTLGFDKIFMINLKRRPERRRRMEACFEELGINATLLEAVDGKLLNESFLKTISFMPEFADPYHKRPMTLGEIGCFMSHYNIWKEIVEKNYETALVLEDDIRFEPFFRLKVKNLMIDLYKSAPNWDLVYFGRKRLLDSEEPWVEGSSILVKAGYSYWTLGYALNLKGAKKLLSGDPLSRLVPVDEYIPILFDKHPQVQWKGYFPQRDLIALSAAPLLLYPTHYTGEKGYISDTEDSIIAKELSNPREDL